MSNYIRISELRKIDNWSYIDSYENGYIDDEATKLDQYVWYDGEFYVCESILDRWVNIEDSISYSENLAEILHLNSNLNQYL